MSLTVTLVALAVAVVVFGLANHVSRRPREPGMAPLIPMGAIQFLALVTIVVTVAHLVSLLTGRPLEGRLFR